MNASLERLIDAVRQGTGWPTLTLIKGDFGKFDPSTGVCNGCGLVAAMLMATGGVPLVKGTTTIHGQKLIEWAAEYFDLEPIQVGDFVAGWDADEPTWVTPAYKLGHELRNELVREQILC